MSFNSTLNDFHSADYLEFVVTSSEFKPQDNFVCKVIFVNSDPSAQKEFIADADQANQNFKFTLINTVSASIKPGRYKVFYNFTKNSTGFRKTFDGGLIQVKPDASTVGSLDFETFNYKALQAVNQLILGHFEEDFVSYSVEGLSITRMTTDELIKAKEYFEEKVNQELGLSQAKKTGKSNQNTLKLKFDPPWRF